MSEPQPTADDRMQIDDASVFEAMSEEEEAPQATPESCFAERKTPTAAAPVIPDAPHDPLVRRWGSRPSMADQAIRLPDTVRVGERRTLVGCLSDETELAKFNEIQAQASRPNPTMAIFNVDKNFFNGAYYYCMDYAAIEYEQLN